MWYTVLLFGERLTQIRRKKKLSQAEIGYPILIGMLTDVMNAEK